MIDFLLFIAALAAGWAALMIFGACAYEIWGAPTNKNIARAVRARERREAAAVERQKTGYR